MDKFHVNGRSQEKSKKKQRVHLLTGRIDNGEVVAGISSSHCFTHSELRCLGNSPEVWRHRLP